MICYKNLGGKLFGTDFLKIQDRRVDYGDTMISIMS